MYVDCFEGRFFGAFPGTDCTIAPQLKVSGKKSHRVECS